MMTPPSASVPQKPLTLRKQVERAVGRIGLWLLVRPLRMMSFARARRCGRGMGRLLFSCLGRYRGVALRNLELIYGSECDLHQRRQMAKRVFEHFGEWAAEFVKMPQLSRDMVDQLCRVDGEDNVRDALSMGRGVLLITGHFGNWEFLLRWLTTHGYTLNVVARRANDPKADRLLNETRTGGGAQVFNRGNSARAVLQSLKRQEIVGLLPDQNAGDVFVPFMGITTGTVDGPAILHLKTGAPLLFSWCVREHDDTFTIYFEPPVVVEPTGQKMTDIAAVTTLINARLEARIRKHPTQWLWLHDRWKSSPGVFSSRKPSSGGDKPLGEAFPPAQEAASLRD